MEIFLVSEGAQGVNLTVILKKYTVFKFLRVSVVCKSFQTNHPKNI